MARRKLLRSFSVYFNHGTAQNFILQPEDVLEQDGVIIRIRGKRGDVPFFTFINMTHVSYTQLQSYWEEVKERPNQPVQDEEPEGIAFR